jgi:hypothetical protein
LNWIRIANNVEIWFEIHIENQATPFFSFLFETKQTEVTCIEEKNTPPAQEAGKPLLSIFQICTKTKRLSYDTTEDFWQLLHEGVHAVVTAILPCRANLLALASQGQQSPREWYALFVYKRQTWVPECLPLQILDRLLVNYSWSLVWLLEQKKEKEQWSFGLA